VHRDQRRAGGERRPERRVAGDGAAHDRAEHDAEDHVEGGRVAHEALLGETHEHDHHDKDDDGAQRHVASAEVLRLELQAERGIDNGFQALHRQPFATAAAEAFPAARTGTAAAAAAASPPPTCTVGKAKRMPKRAMIGMRAPAVARSRQRG
jgi:hypothetical protein